MRCAALALVLVAGCTTTAIAIASEDDTAVVRTGENFQASFAGLGPDWELQLNTRSESRAVPAKYLVVWGHWRDQAEEPLCLVGNDSLLVATLMSVGDRDISVESRLWRRVAIPRGFVRGIVFQPPLDPAQRDRLLQRIWSFQLPQDRIWLANGDELTGRVLPSVEKSGANLFGVPAIQFQLPGGAPLLTIETVNAVAIAFGRDLEPPTPPGPVSAYVALREGSCVHAAAASIGEADATLELGRGVTLSAAKGVFLQQVTMVQPLHSQVVYLSDLEPVSYKHVPFLDMTWPLARDRSVAGGLLRENGNVYRKGLSFHSTARAVYSVPPGARVLEAELAVDESAGRLGSVIYRVFEEVAAERASSRTWRLAYESPAALGGASPLSVSLTVDGVQRIALVVDATDQGDVMDRANWLNARFVK
jgi:hypothetical protein